MEGNPVPKASDSGGGGGEGLAHGSASSGDLDGENGIEHDRSFRRSSDESEEKQERFSGVEGDDGVAGRALWLLGRITSGRRAEGDELLPRVLPGMEGKGVRGICIARHEVVRSNFRLSLEQIVRICGRKDRKSNGIVSMSETFTHVQTIRVPGCGMGLARLQENF